ncbi:MAG TPA: glucosaminidase domain-containing protein [Bacteroidia bacterium]|nr:glucosaminidase domain-containing protein [Bacteroidia bacterium]
MKTQCCYTKNYTKKDDSAICTNTRCANYLSVTNIIKENTVKRYLTAAWLLLFLVAFTSNDFSNVNSEAVTKQMSASLKRMSIPLTKEALRNEIAEAEIVCPDEAFAQLLLESGNLNSFLLKRTNNMMGMRYPFRRPTTATGLYLPAKDTIIYGNSASLKKFASQNNYAVYACWQEAVEDYMLWQTTYFHLADRYLQFLGKVYAEDSTYEQKIKSVMARQ